MTYYKNTVFNMSFKIDVFLSLVFISCSIRKSPFGHLTQLLNNHFIIAELMYQTLSSANCNNITLHSVISA